jgi:hypothetical protein
VIYVIIIEKGDDTLNQGEFITVLITCAILFCIFIQTLIEEYRFKRKSRIIEGTITELYTTHEHSGKRPTVTYFDDVTNSNHVFKSNAAVTHFKKIGDKYKLRVFTNGNKRKHESLYVLHFSSIQTFILFALSLCVLITYINPNNNVTISEGYDKFYNWFIIEVPVIILSFLFYLNRKTSSY